MAVQLHKASSCFYLAAPALSWGRFFRSDSPTCAFAADSGKSRSKVFTYGLCCPHRLRLRSPSLAPGAPSVPQSAARAGCLGPSRKTPSSPEARCLAKNLRNARSSTSHGTKRRDMHFSNGPTCVMRRVVRLPSYCFPSSAARPFFSRSTDSRENRAFRYFFCQAFRRRVHFSGFLPQLEALIAF